FPAEREELDLGGDPLAHVDRGLRPPPIGDRDRVTGRLEPLGEGRHHLLAAAAEGLGPVQEAGQPLPAAAAQYAPRPERTAGSVASSSSMSRASDQPATYW